MKERDFLRFASKARPAAGGCWHWTAGIDSSGYGVMWWNGRNHHAQRMAWRFYRGPIPGGLQVCHHCDVRHCVNPEHLFLGTGRDNMADCVAKGRKRGLHGSASGTAKLTEAQVRSIRREQGTAQRELARRYGVSVPTISMILSRKTWTHIEEVECPDSPQIN